MAYTVRVRARQPNANAYFHVAEMAAFHSGSWSNTDGVLKLTMSASGTSGMLRYQTETGAEAFTVAIGVHNYKPWVHILPDVAPSETCVALLPQYYAGGKHSGIPIVPTCTVYNSAQRSLTATFVSTEGHDYSLDIVIG
ncbi:hypothetical protein ONZ43_g5891 [Nemania bipapillata]|uniref:Uncharacterized protein n=1 Tax=Nemania bipapillata TaxID=110536 RepID=A0ACC2I5B8_9PEZI|nr:hypothetical protein ONZ43_g5891 [Nemania bipapillata]